MRWLWVILLFAVLPTLCYAQAIFIGDTSAASATGPLGRGNGFSYVRGTFTTAAGGIFIVDSMRAYGANGGDGNDNVCIGVHTDSSTNARTRVATGTAVFNSGTAQWFSTGAVVDTLQPGTQYWISYGSSSNFSGYYNASVTKSKNDANVQCADPWPIGTITSGNALIIAIWGHQQSTSTTILSRGHGPGADAKGHSPSGVVKGHKP